MIYDPLLIRSVRFWKMAIILIGVSLDIPDISYTKYQLFSITCVLLPFSCTQRLRKFSRHCKMEPKNFFCYLKALPDVVWTWGSSIEKLLSRVMQLWGRKNWKWKKIYFTWMRMDHHFPKKKYFFLVTSQNFFIARVIAFCLALSYTHNLGC